MPTYFLTAAKMPCWAINRVDRFRRSFLWRGHDPDRVRGGHCLVKWEVCTWDSEERPWHGLLKLRDPTDRHLFFAFTEITIGNGKKTPFWEANWLHPKQMAPKLYEKARYKFRSVDKELKIFNWLRNIKEIDSEDELNELVLLFTVLNGITLTNQDDLIRWKWMANGKYSAKSAYEIQFTGLLSTFPELCGMVSTHPTEMPVPSLAANA
ncbi:hypothetical protein PR202_gb16659 [Eleusine coracana subsp. coracana]|uniref:Uncharacterized protein n=1 Tax=Eleusine coracana subsp. coracana TaxID=191504 RepID=A0AAV5F0Z4_ELECO|nr:hypothetical protein PR202_gb16659 [Eleusine coracana subsp. coracana]